MIAAPACTGPLDRDYLAEALARSGRPAPSAEIETEQLHGGRTGAQVWRLIAGTDSYVVKLVPAHNWRGIGMNCPEGGEPRLWLSGALASLPDELQWPVIDAALHDDGHYRLLMTDVGAGIRDRGTFSHDDTHAFFRHLACMHARFFDSELLERAPLPDVTGAVRVCAEPLLFVAGRRETAEPWIEAFLGDFEIMAAFVPMFVDIIGPKLSDAFFDIVEDDLWKRRLREQPATLLQGDPRRANVSFSTDCTYLIDWEFAAKGPPGCDLQGHCFLHYWGYPPDGTAPGDDCDDMRRAYGAALAERLGRPIDEQALALGWNLGWLKMMAMLGFLLIDPLYPDGGTSDDRALARALSERAIQRALDIRESLA